MGKTAQRTCTKCQKQIHGAGKGTTRRPRNAPVQHFHVKCAPPKARTSRKATPHRPKATTVRLPQLSLARPQPLTLYEAKEVAPGVWENAPEPIVAPSTALVRLNEARSSTSGSIVRYVPLPAPPAPTFPWSSLSEGALLVLAGAAIGRGLSSRA